MEGLDVWNEPVFLHQRKWQLRTRPRYKKERDARAEETKPETTKAQLERFDMSDE